MRSTIFARMLVSLTAAAGIATGSLMGASASFAAPPSASAPSSENAGALAIVNLGLTTRQAMNVQCWLMDFWGYTGAIDGIAGPGTQAAFKRFADATAANC